jgi:hypothetical protein
MCQNNCLKQQNQTSKQTQTSPQNSPPIPPSEENDKKVDMSDDERRKLFEDLNKNRQKASRSRRNVVVS